MNDYCTHKLENRLCQEKNNELLEKIIILLYIILIEIKKGPLTIDGGTF